MILHLHATPWTPEEDAVIVENWAKLSATKLGQLLNRSKNSVIGRANRMGMKKGHAYPTRVPKAVVRKARLKDAIWRKIVIKPEKVYETNIDTLPFIGVKIWDLEKHHCRFMKDPSTLEYCGHQTKERSSYCQHHHERIYRPIEKGL